MPTNSFSGFAVLAPAPAKINLALAVTGRREDGYHLLDSLVTFTAFGDRIGLSPAEADRFTLSGRFSKTLAAEGDNLVTRARDRLRAAIEATGQAAPPVHIHLEKNLPIASGIGGGSADAAATLRALARLTGRPLPPDAEVLRLGADVPVCLSGRTARMSGIGEVLAPLPPLPALWVVLVNPRVAVPTPQVFAALTRRDNPPLPELPSGALASAGAFATWLADQTRNDLIPPARAVSPILSEVQSTLAVTPGCLLARMSGSGGTHFGLYASAEAARAAARSLAAAHPGWWITPGNIQS